VKKKGPPYRDGDRPWIVNFHCRTDAASYLEMKNFCNERLWSFSAFLLIIFEFYKKYNHLHSMEMPEKIMVKGDGFSFRRDPNGPASPYLGKSDHLKKENRIKRAKKEKDFDI
jgi:hypothetical protein